MRVIAHSCQVSADSDMPSVGSASPLFSSLSSKDSGVRDEKTFLFTPTYTKMPRLLGRVRGKDSVFSTLQRQAASQPPSLPASLLTHGSVPTLAEQPGNGQHFPCFAVLKYLYTLKRMWVRNPTVRGGEVRADAWSRSEPLTSLCSFHCLEGCCVGGPLPRFGSAVLRILLGNQVSVSSSQQCPPSHLRPCFFPCCTRIPW